ncbi:MAG: NRDE family protein [Cyclobacteriaceae bacterium]
MCLIAFAWNSHPKYKLILIANRDEFYERPSATASFWKDCPDIYAGRDLVATGTWMGISKSGRFGAITNYRDIKNIQKDARSRGDIIPRYLSESDDPKSFSQKLNHYSSEYNGFNFLASDFKTMTHYSNYQGKVNVIDPGIHGLSNAFLDTPWPKVESLKRGLRKAISSKFDHKQMFDLLSDTQEADEKMLPRTGVPLEWEKALSSVCIRTEKYGTCSSTVITVTHAGVVDFSEKTHAIGDKKEKTVKSNFTIKLD